MKLAIPICSALILWQLTGLGLFAQNTVGLLSIEAGETYEGYNLIYPHNQPNVYLLDLCGEVVHTWTDDDNFRPGNSAYILPNGNLVKTKRENSFLNDPIWAGGGGAIVEIRNWDNLPLFSFELNDSLYRLHHDVAPLPNGNVLMITWERKTGAEARAAGRAADLLPEDELWSEAILEWDPRKDSIVWSWSVFDHLVQDLDEEVANFGVVADHPELIDINYDEHDGHPDWLHVNAIGYNPVLDQIVLSVPYFNEMWVIDHSTTTEEAAGHSGGNAGKGGDLLFRWGNPAAYDQGTEADKQLFFQHDVHWVAPQATAEDPAFGSIAVYNNRAPGGRSPGQIVAAVPESGGYTYPLTDGVFEPADFAVTVTHPGDEQRVNSASVSSVQFLPNGNTLLLAGRWGFAYEIAPDRSVVWEYVVPLKNGGPAVQGDTLGISDNLTFRMERYAADYVAFEGRDLSPKGYLEQEPNEGYCALLLPAREPLAERTDIHIYPNPVRRDLTIEWTENGVPLQMQLHDLSGKTVERFSIRSGMNTVDLSRLEAGIYLLRAPGMIARKIVVLP
ncbi:aryl-sulfate sulfotransferase [Flavilitoribacter nigricans]|uniref:Secretion system C-terminal sorting domain-containing protein n=1 Tax=Flavilitoribacter nigricans (strain ATCC 23147 / DSM 23189 / NBRC 102662 / NCIMB 1420 / SS-2) TaxID=1122177 RepID=A0A2D0NGD2_FLAN2|nr:aryl-sulfate sulfotransferase [Flavilitoribacter nigricans]PHN07229.1 hypothetical protein CRP01_08385 [Flavilitoribacter nigricans DSM 23189 = NBRC 102662]